MSCIKEKNKEMLKRAALGDRKAEEEIIKDNMGLVKSLLPLSRWIIMVASIREDDEHREVSDLESS